MASLETLQERLSALQETTGQLKDLIDRLAAVKFQPGSAPLPSSMNMSSSIGSISSLASIGATAEEDTSNVAAELSSEINQVLREEEEELELLSEEIIDLRPARPVSEAEHRKTRLREGVQRLEGELKDCRTSFRRAQLSARRNLQAAQKLERYLLLASYTASATALNTSTATSSQGDNNSNPDDTTTPTRHTQLFTARDRRRLRQKGGDGGARGVVTASSDVTSALRRTHALIAGEVAKSAFATQTLAESTAALQELQQTYAGLDGLLARSRDLVGTLLTSQKSDTWYLRTAFYVLLATLSWLVFRRFLYGPLWWVLWLPARTAWRTGSSVSSSLAGSGKGARMEVADPSGGGGKAVGVGEQGAVPTIKAAGGVREAVVEEPEGMVEKIGRMMDDVERAAANLTEEETAAGEKNPMKRMWEEEGVDGDDVVRVVVEEERVRDEL
ncbi:hypothetical protein B0H67DRAFT_501619 [Lasiosphaeris hirsuta]|uniref:Sec20 C-terminal domain-containing protein n=1 Tax=Lasiosphaeris hirsuta TaxID=260670 RepID=A0AA40BCH2_9PEZI|nr:hypothetical protein B0H67DRAFT_501619 [Lasiosphaeris hirsuta]